MLSYRSFGHFWCPMCFCRREFISEDERVTDIAHAECEECQYQFGVATDELHLEGTGTNQRYVTKRTPVISEELANKARAEKRKAYVTAMAASGVRMEALRPGAARRAAPEPTPALPARGEVQGGSRNPADR